MAIKTVDPHAWLIITDTKTGKSMTILNDQSPEHNFPFGFTANFSNSATPPVNTATLYNLSDKHQEFFHKGYKVVLAFNWGKERKIISQGFITKLDKPQHDGTTDTHVITFTEGTNYSNIKARKLKIKKTEKVNKHKTVEKTKAGYYKKTRSSYAVNETYKRGKKKGQKHVVHHWEYGHKWLKPKKVKHRVKTRVNKTKITNKTWPKGTSYKTIIEGVAAQSGIKIAKLELAQNPVMKKPYTATGKPLNLIKKLVKPTGSVITYVRGNFEIVNPRSEKRVWYEIDDKDLLQPPSYNEADEGEKGTYEIEIPLVPEITTNVGILMKSKYLKGRFFVKSGQHTSDGENPQTQCSLEAM